MPYATRLAQLRAELERQELDGFLLPRTDEYHGEYLAPYAERLAWLSGFTGSAGYAVILRDKAAVFVDGRYTLQVRYQVSDTLFEYHDFSRAAIQDWIREHRPDGGRLGYDPWLHTPDALSAFKDLSVQLIPCASNPVDDIWVDQPVCPKQTIIAHPLQFSGKDSLEKRQDITKNLKSFSAIILTQSDSLSWLLNIRSHTVPYSPVCQAFAILYTDNNHVDVFGETEDTPLALPNVHFHARADFGEALDRLTGTVGVSAPNAWITARLKQAGITYQNCEDPCLLPKACKNQTELDGMRRAHENDGLAVVRFLAWLDAHALTQQITEIDASDKLLSFRQQQDLFQYPSFPTISGAGKNGAIIHYQATPDTNAILEQASLYLVDSGGQYLNGTTDITRTILIGNIATPDMRHHFTLVLKGHIALASARFPKGTTGAQLDTLARIALWNAGLNFNHGTGHGVGAYLNVHEGPQNISHRSTVPLKPGMILSNEPGYYREGKYGIRIENLMAVKPETPLPNGEIPMMSFETLTMAPLDLRLIDVPLLTKAEQDWINQYHQTVRDTLLPKLRDEAEKNWLVRATESVKLLV